MSRISTKSGQDFCGDCGASDPQWASLNRGLLVCTECATVHRTLGRHISRVKHVKRSFMNPHQLNMVYALHSDGSANAIWEYALQEHGKMSLPRGNFARKPTPHASFPTKADFIRSKHEQLSFAFKPDHRLERTSSIDELSQQLHANVRTGNLESTLRLLYLGADPNYYHPEKLMCPIHVAARAGQNEQVELLAIYGVDVTLLDGCEGKTATQIARDAGDMKLALRLQEIEFEVSDRLTYFVCGQRPDHSRGQHLIVPQLGSGVALPAETAKAARQRLQGLSNNHLSNLALDLYEEVDRRELDGVQTSFGPAVLPVPAIPWHPGLSGARNGSRQKLSSLSHANFCLLIVDCITEVKRRRDASMLAGNQGYQIQANSLNNNVGFNQSANMNGAGSIMIKDANRGATSQKAQLTSLTPVGDDGEEDYDEPFYDSVASEEDYAIVDKNKKVSPQQSVKPDSTTRSSTSQHVPSANGYVPRQQPLSQLNDNQLRGGVDRQSAFALATRLEDSQSIIKELEKSKRQMSDQISAMQNMIHQLVFENNTLRGRRGGSAEPAVGDERFAASAARDLWQNGGPAAAGRQVSGSATLGGGGGHHGYGPGHQNQNQFRTLNPEQLHHFHQQQQQREQQTRANQTLSSVSVGASPSAGFLSGQFLPSEAGDKPASAVVQRSSSLHSHLPRPNTMFETSSTSPARYGGGVAAAAVVPVQRLEPGAEVSSSSSSSSSAQAAAGGPSSAASPSSPPPPTASSSSSSSHQLETLPSTEDIHRGIRPVTAGLQDLKAFIEGKYDAKRRSDDDAEVFQKTVHRVREAVMHFMTAFPNPPSEGPMKDAMRQLICATAKLLDLGDNWGGDGRGGARSSAPLQFDVANLRDSVFACAYEVAKATKEMAAIVEQQRAKELREI